MTNESGVISPTGAVVPAAVAASVFEGGGGVITLWNVTEQCGIVELPLHMV